MKVLIIDDDNFIRAIYTAALKQEGIDVELAVDGKEGIEKIKKTKPDLVLLDMIMPKLDGFEVLEKIKREKSSKAPPVVVFSSLNQDSDIQEALKLGATKYLPKDQYSPKEIVNEIKKILVLKK